MTSTPETWDDVGCLQLKVDCVSRKVEDVQKNLEISHGMNASELQKLKNELALLHVQRKKERCQAKVCITIAACVLALHLFVMYPELTPGSHESSEASTLVPAAQSSKDSKRNIRSGQVPKKNPANDAGAEDQIRSHIQTQRRIEELSSENEHPEKESTKEVEEVSRSRTDVWEEDHHQKTATEKPHTIWNLLEQNDTQRKLASEPEFPSAQLPQSSINAKGPAQRYAKGVVEGLEVRLKDANVTSQGHLTLTQSKKKDNESDKRQTDGVREDVTLSENPPQNDQQELIKATQHDILPATDDVNDFDHGMFWVCFPLDSLEQDVRKYAQVFNEVARSQKRMVYPFCYMDTRLLSMWEDHFCDDVKKITFVLELDRRKKTASDKKELSSQMPVQSSFEECGQALVQSEHVKIGRIQAADLELWTRFESPAWFRRTFGSNQDIKASLVEKFINDVFAGKLREVVPIKGDL